MKKFLLLVTTLIVIAGAYFLRQRFIVQNKDTVIIQKSCSKNHDCGSGGFCIFGSCA